MRILILLFLISGVFASYSESTLYLPKKTTPSIITEHQIELARFSLLEKKHTITVSYGDGVLSNQLETVTKNLLSNAWLYNIVSTFTDEFESKSRRARFLVNIKKRELSFSYAF